jgi:uncharacterized membrane protein YphA (DoxX/SURF4 family)
MSRLILSYPDGIAGAALLLRRLSCALLAFPSLARLWPASAAWLMAIPSAAIVLALVTGFGTRPAAAVLVLALIADVPSADGETALLLLSSAGAVGALALMGAGAYSIDARRFGRRVIHLGPRSPDRGGLGSP